VLQVDLLAVLALGDLRGTLLVEVSGLDLSLQLFEFFALNAYFLHDSGLFFLLHLHAGHFPGEALLHLGLADAEARRPPLVLLALPRVESCLSEGHNSYFLLFKCLSY